MGIANIADQHAQINLPRAAGTCTRVPIEVRLRKDPDTAWRCIVKIRKETQDTLSEEDHEEVSVSRKAAARHPSTYPLTTVLQVSRTAPENTFGTPLTDPENVELAIRRAQLALLNPSVNALRFLTYNIPDKDVEKPLGSVGQLSFSKNVVVVEISGANVPDLTLIDLPGIIHSVGKKEDKANIKLVDNLVKHYIAKDCLILCVITMKGQQTRIRSSEGCALTWSSA